MADLGGEAGAGFAGKAASAVGGGVVWGIFVTMLLIIPTLFAGLLSPFVSKANKVIKDKVDTIPVGQSKPKAKTGKRTRADREYEARMAELDAQREEQELAERIARLQARKKQKTTRSASATVI